MFFSCPPAPPPPPPPPASTLTHPSPLMTSKNPNKKLPSVGLGKLIKIEAAFCKQES